MAAHAPRHASCCVFEELAGRLEGWRPFLALAGIEIWLDVVCHTPRLLKSWKPSGSSLYSIAIRFVSIFFRSFRTLAKDCLAKTEVDSIPTYTHHQSGRPNTPLLSFVVRDDGSIGKDWRTSYLHHEATTSLAGSSSSSSPIGKL